MILNNQTLESISLPKHRSHTRAVLSALLGLFVVMFVAGAWLLVREIPGKVPGKVPAAVSVSQEGEEVPPPIRIIIPTLEVDAPVVGLGLNADRTLQVPKGEWEVGWYMGRPSPGAIGPAVMVGHLDSARGPAIFQDLHQLKPGDEIEVVHTDGSISVFKVDSSEKFSQNDFPTAKVYGAIDYAGLRLITCAGTYSRLKGRYSDNLVVFATLKP